MDRIALRRRLRRRRGWSIAIVAVLVAAPPLLFGHRGVDAVMNLAFPGAGLYEQHRPAALAFATLTIVATVAWLRWGTDWFVALVLLLAMTLSGVVADGADVVGPSATRMGHEFPLVIAVIAALGSLRAAGHRVPIVRRALGRRRRQASQLLPVPRCQVAALRALSGTADKAAVVAIETDDVRRRAGRIGLVARGRLGGDPFRIDHAHARAALALCGRLSPEQRTVLHADAARSWAGVPCSEPGWIRPLDATLAAIAMDDVDLGLRWQAALRSSLPLRRGHRPAWIWAPLAVAGGRAPDWEHATVTALNRAVGWIDHDYDWAALRQRALGAAARGVDDPHDERLIAAARCWTALVEDRPAAAVLARPTVRHDPVACALDDLAGRLRETPDVLRRRLPSATAPDGHQHIRSGRTASTDDDRRRCRPPAHA